MRWVFLRGIFRAFHTKRTPPPSSQLELTTKKNSRDAKEVLENYDSLKKQGVKPSISLIVSALKACSGLKDLKKGMRIHSEIISSGNDGNIFVQSTLVDMYSKCGSMADARRVFDSMCHPNVVSWTVIISGYVQCGEPETALKLFELMQEKGVSPNERTYVAAIRACSSLGTREDGKQADGKVTKAASLETGRLIHSQLASKGYERDAFVASSLVDMYSKCGSMEDARNVFDKMTRRDLISWTAVILGYSRSGDGGQALDLFSRMQDEGFVPDPRTFLAAINACTSLAAKEVGKQVQGKLVKVECLARGTAIHSQLSKFGHDRSDLFVASGLVDMYAKCGSMVDSRRVFEAMKQRNLVSWTSIILGYAQSGEQPELALDLFTRMQAEGFQPNARTFVATLKACSSLGDNKEGEKQATALAKGRQIHLQLSKHGYESDTFVSNSLVDMYAKCGSMTEARQVFEGMKSHTAVSWNAIIMGYAQAGEGEQALELFSRMKEKGFVPDVPTYVSVLKACSSLAALESGRRIHDELSSAGYGKDDLVVNSLISLYGKCGSLVEAQQVFDSTSKRDLISWSALIAGYGYQGDTKQAFDLFERMQNEERLQPDGVTFLSILTACSHAGLVDRGKEYFQAMCSDYVIIPSIEHYTCMVDLLGRANHLDDAVAMVRGMPYEPNSTVWMTLLGACRKWKNAKIGKVAFESLVRIDEKDGAAYVLMADTYASLGLWEESARVNAMRRNTKAWKKQGQSWWVDRAGKIHRFGAGDSTHPQIEEIRARMREVVARIKEEGYVPDVSSVLYNISDEDKEAALCGHSEKLAIGCALVNSAPGTSVRIAKNLRVCEDCHKATEIISRVERRVVVCRDANRFHEFRDGKCSCGGFW
ncbi:pentatricopeptide repeat-containing protein At3g12770-like [Selaginella moellendorffii]|uniref:pentatricopeptide repeat-containing protein At3g12770-like n=1 Tax=Selaginella moellendorffii TaxID=88036 RepID=UPI000D1C2B66|nr:pentatricopeptide repeat-containing protein At3g12770-like [Selaginella moellendorffii]|eukprot:XP_024518063.1 pentatricopeptide repeat-containing protein At3g12770-like [Selaginella moellendorffii]